ncbi:hypothetical protein J6590_067398 [Homalodisca vitripennis]|nr:hypothetical protein J6590_067398 [Homalodisca vitripennis]
MDQGIIKNQKQFYRRLLVEYILTEDSDALKIKLDILQASRMCKKAWYKEDYGEKANDIIAEAVPSVDGWEDVITDPAISFEDFVNVDEDVAVCGEITDAEIIAEVLNNKQDGDMASGDEDGQSSVGAEINVPSAAEAAHHIMELRRIFESKNDYSDNELPRKDSGNRFLQEKNGFQKKERCEYLKKGRNRLAGRQRAIVWRLFSVLLLLILLMSDIDYKGSYPHICCCRSLSIVIF